MTDSVTRTAAYGCANILVLHPFSRQHDFELEEFSYRIVACEDKVEDIYTELAPLKQEDACATE